MKKMIAAKANEGQEKGRIAAPTLAPAVLFRG